MSLSVTSAEGVTMITITPNHQSKCPLICQLLCCSPVCFVSQSLRQQLGNVHTILGTLQIMVGLMSIAYGVLPGHYMPWYYPLWGAAFWTGGVFIAAGIICIVADKYPSVCLISFTVLVNLVSLALAITAIVFYSMDLTSISYQYNCADYYEDRYGYGYGRYDNRYDNTPSPQAREMKEICKRYGHILKLVFGGLDIIMIMLTVLQVCVTISSCVLSLKALCKKNRDEKDPELHKPLIDEVLASPAC